MLTDLGDLALNRGNEGDVKAFAKVAHTIQTSLCQERNTTLKEKTTNKFFKLREAKGGQESEAKCLKDLVSEPIEISDSESRSGIFIDE